MNIKIRRFDFKVLFNIMLAIYPLVVDFYVNNLNATNYILIPFLLISIHYVLINRKIQISVEEKYLLAFWVYAFGISIIMVRKSGFYVPISYWLHIIEILAIIIIIRRYVYNNKVFFMSYYMISFIVLVIFYYQFFVLETTGTLIKFARDTQEFSRACSVFSEPAHYCIYISFILFTCLFRIDKFNLNNNFRIIFSFAISLSMIMSMSTTGLFYIVYIWGAWFLLFHYKKIRKYKFVLFILMLIIIPFIYTEYGWLNRSITHLQEMDVNQITSGSFRVFRGFAVFIQFNLAEKIFGIGAGISPQYILNMRIRTIYDNYNNLYNSYMSAFSLIFVTGGIFGFIIYLFFLGKSLIGQNVIGILSLILYILYAISNEELHLPQLVITMMLFLYLKDKNKIDVNIK